MNPYQKAAIDAARRHGVCPEQVLGRSMRPKVVRPRQEAMWLMNLRGRSLPRIAQWADRDHTTVLSGIRRHQARYEAEHRERWS